jgi:lysophospholipase L1-like esterase
MRFTALLLAATTAAAVPTAQAETAADRYLAPFKLPPAPARPKQPLLRTGDRLAICGDSITEQKLYSRIMETYLTVCVPELNVTVRQYGWSGEQAGGFLHRMTNDVLRFNPTIATTCYGMNDHRYVPYTPEIGDAYRANMGDVVRSFQAHGVRVVLGTAGPVGKMPSWVKSAKGTVLDLNLNLAELRNINLQIAATEKTAGFADIFRPMLMQEFRARSFYGTNYAVPGKDGVHPGLAGQTMMAWSFLRALGVDGQIGTITVSLGSGKATATAGHAITASGPGSVTLHSTRYPFVVPSADPADDNSIRSAFQWIPFEEELNRFLLVVKDARTSARYEVKWGDILRIYSGAELRHGVNLAQDFTVTPFDTAFRAVDTAVAAKQAYETKQIKELFHGEAGRTDMEGTVQRTEAERAPLAAAIPAAMVPVDHTITITRE